MLSVYTTKGLKPLFSPLLYLNSQHIFIIFFTIAVWTCSWHAYTQFLICSKLNSELGFFLRYYHFYTFQASSKKKKKQKKTKTVSLRDRIYYIYSIQLFYFPNGTSGTKSTQLLQSPKYMHLKQNVMIVNSELLSVL